MKKIITLMLPVICLTGHTLKAQETLSGPATISSSTIWTSNGWIKGMKLATSQTIQFAADNHHFGIGASTPNGLYFFSTPTDGTDQAATYHMTIMQNGNVGIGTLNPGAALDVHGTFRLGVTGYTGGEAYCIGFTRENNAHLFGIHPQGLLLGGDADGFDMKILPNGNVGIGTASPQAKLAVKGTVLAEKVKVSVKPEDWPDFVFLPGYRLPSLQEMEKFIRENGHLPDMPAAATVAQEGLDLGEMNRKLLQKVEELTLHLIEMEKQQQEMKATIKQLTERTQPAR
ncbi:hypothetical protein [Chitinophaga sp.]|uniref:hypothetical protein n=1 Tax=Chitinophaga sp. TaxID=1869181 RepID=UPI0031CFA09E